MSQLKQKKSRSILVDKQLKHGYPLRKNQIKNCDVCKGNEERIRTLQLALREVLEQNDALRSRVAEIEALINECEDKIQDEGKSLMQEIIQGSV